MGNVVAIRRTDDSRAWDGPRRSMDMSELSGFFQGHEATIGFSSSFGGMEAALSGLAVHDPFANPYEHLLSSVWTDSRPTLGRAVWQALKTLDATGDRVCVLVLYRLCSDTVRLSPNALSALGKEIAKIARFTDAAKDVRDELAFSRSSIRSEVVRANVTQANDEAVVAASEHFWTMAPSWEALTTELQRLRTQPQTPRTERTIEKLESKIEALWGRMDALAHVTTTDPLPAVLTSITAADAETSIDEAIAHALLTFKDEARATFIKKVKLQGKSVIDQAFNRYRDARENVR